MKDIWMERYQEITEKELKNPVDVLVGFNANIDVKYDVEELELDFEDAEAEKKDSVSDVEDLKAVLKHCVENGENLEIDNDGFEFDEDGKEEVGGQAGIMANYLSLAKNSVIFYTPFLSQELADLMDNRVLYPVYDEEFVLKNVRDSANTDRTKRNLIFEYDGERTGRLIVSDRMKGFGTYFRKGVEENLETMDENLERVLFSGYHDVEGNRAAKFRKAEKQLEQIETPIHMEYVDVDPEALELIVDHVLPHVNSIGLDEHEMKELEDKLELDTSTEEGSLGEAFETCKELIDEYGLERAHIHTYDFHIVVVEEDYEVTDEKIRESMLFGEISAIQMADTGEIPEADDLSSFNTDDKHIRRLDELEDFQDFFGIQGFVETGIAEIEDYRVIAIPTIIHEDPKRLVGMGDIISSGAFVHEVR